MQKVSGHSHAAEMLELSPKPGASVIPKPPGSPPKKNAGACETGRGLADWRLEPHVCRHCFSRLVSHGRTYACPNCGASADGADATCLCSCGLKIRRDGATGLRLMDAGIRCKPNPAPTPDFPSLFVATTADPDC